MNRMKALVLYAAPRFWFLLAACDLLAAATMGVLLRTMYLVELPFVTFKPWLHGHSHGAMLGWLFIGTCLVFLHDWGKGRLTRRDVLLLAGIQVAVVVMLISFPIQGYGGMSILASTMHALLSLLLLGRLWTRTNSWPAMGSRALLRTSMFFFGLSLLGTVAIGPILALDLQSHEIYYWSIQFYLHFQFNGWFWFAAMAIGVRWAEQHGIDLNMDSRTMVLWILSAVLTYALAIAWSEPHPVVFGLVSLGVVLQLWAAIRTFWRLSAVRGQARRQFPDWARWSVGVALACMAMKVLVQTAVAVPLVARMAFTIRHYVIGFIHLNTLGIMTMLLLTYALWVGWLDRRSRVARFGLWTLTLGIVASEFLLFLQGTFFWAGLGIIPGHYWHMVLTSALIPVGLALLLMGRRSGTHPRISSPGT